MAYWSFTQHSLSLSAPLSLSLSVCVCRCSETRYDALSLLRPAESLAPVGTNTRDFCTHANMGPVHTEGTVRFLGAGSRDPNAVGCEDG